MGWKLSKLFSEAVRGASGIVQESSVSPEGSSESIWVEPVLDDPWLDQCERCGSRSVARLGNHVRCSDCCHWKRTEPEASQPWREPNAIERKFGPPYRGMPAGKGNFKDVFSGGFGRAMMQILGGRR